MEILAVATLREAIEAALAQRSPLGGAPATAARC
jgi:hypothetical protein